MDNSLMKSNLKQLDFVGQTPLRGSHANLGHANDFTSSQKLKYDTAHRQLSHTLNNYANAPAARDESCTVWYLFFI